MNLRVPVRALPSAGGAVRFGGRFRARWRRLTFRMLHESDRFVNATRLSRSQRNADLGARNHFASLELLHLQHTVAELRRARKFVRSQAKYFPTRVDAYAEKCPRRKGPRRYVDHVSAGRDGRWAGFTSMPHRYYI